MATGIVKRHSRRCGARDGKRCRCGGRYEAWVSVRQTGGKRTKVRKSFEREDDAKAWRGDALAAANRGKLRPAKRDSRDLATALEEFVAGMRTGEVRPLRRSAYKPATIRAYEQHVRVHIAPSILGPLRITEVSRAAVQAFCDDLLATGLNPSSVANILCPIQAFYRRLQRRDILAVNPAAEIDLPATMAQRPTRIVSRGDAERLLAALGEEDRAMWATAFYAGLRRGELRAMRWSDVDLANGVLRVERSWDQEEGPIDPKSESSRRSVPILAVLRDYLTEQKLRTGREGSDLVFGRTAAEPFAPTTTDKRAKRRWKAAELEGLTMHDCRHTFASMLIDAGITNPKAIQDCMGHSKIKTTYDVYGHLLPGGHAEVRERMDAYLAAGELDMASSQP